MLPALHFFINIFPMSDSQNNNRLFLNTVNNPVIAHPKLPVALQGFPQGLTVLVGGGGKSLFNGLADSLADGFGKAWDVFVPNRGMVADGEGGSIPRHLRGREARLA